jgi:hypothetical protein
MDAYSYIVLYFWLTNFIFEMTNGHAHMNNIYRHETSMHNGISLEWSDLKITC